MTKEPTREQEYQFVFIVGAAGSGTTMLTRILSSPGCAVGLGGNFTTIPARHESARRLMEEFGATNATLWDRESGHEACRKARDQLPRIVERLLEIEDYRAVTHVIFKRSAPFFKGNRYRPDLSDLPLVFRTLRVVVSYRDPRAATASACRRGFAQDLKQCAVICEEQLTYLAAQLGTLAPDLYRVVPYESFCMAPEPWANRLAEFCQLPQGDISKAIEAENVQTGRNGAWSQKLPPADRDFLAAFFDRRRLAQWRLLAGEA